MKTILALVCALATSVASAVTLNWNATQVAFDGNALKNSTAVTGYLIFLESGSYASDYSITTESTVSSIVSSIGAQVDTKNKTSAVAKLNSDYQFEMGTTYDNGDVFGMLLHYNDGSKDWYNLSTAVYTMANGVADPPTNPDKANFTFSYSTAGETGKLSAGGGWTAVPEPSTAALALAGLALLIKRRRA